VSEPDPIKIGETGRLFSVSWGDMCKADQWALVLAAALPLSLLWHVATGTYLVPAGVPFGIQLVGYEIVAAIWIHGFLNYWRGAP
jgi:hypothetical protein